MSNSVYKITVNSIINVEILNVPPLKSETQLECASNALFNTILDVLANEIC